MPPNAFHVVIERPRDVGAGAATRLADAVAERYGIPADTLRERLAAGRLRVKSNVDRATAETFASELEKLGAVCVILDAATNQPIVVAKPPPAFKPPAPPPKPASQLSSGLSAAFTKGAEQQDLGALGSGEVTVSTRDGNDDGRSEAAADDGPMLAATFGPPVTAAPQPSSSPRSAGPKSHRPDLGAAPVDLFAPPDDDKPPELALDTMPKRVGTTAPPRMSTPPPVAEAMPVEPEAPAPSRGLADWIRDRRVRLGAGVLLAILLGFIPATVIASMRESSAFGEIDRDIQKRFQSVYSEDDWHALDAMLARERTRKEDERRSIALQSMVIWALAGGALAFVWFRTIDWDRVADRFAR